MKHTATFVLLLTLTFSFGQQTPDEIAPEILEAIKNDVWVPFMEAYDQGDSNKLKSIHTKDIVRVTIRQNQIETGESYLEDFGGFVQSVKERGDHMAIAFAILSAATNEAGDMAYQTGYYRLSVQKKGAIEPNYVGYGYFNVGLRLENGHWKIWLDSDNHTDISQDDFYNAPAVYELRD